MSPYLAPYGKLLAWILLPPLIGLLLRRSGAPRQTSRLLFLFGLFCCQTPVVLLAIWVARASKGAQYLPFLTLTGWLVTALIAWRVSLKWQHSVGQRGAFIVSMCLSNHGYTLLGLVAFMVFGETGLAQATYALLPVVPFLVLFCFPVGLHYGEGGRARSLSALLKTAAVDPRSVPLLAMLAGLALNVAGVERPHWCATLLSPLVYLGTATTGMAVGVLLDGSALRGFAREHAFSFAYRSTAYPLLFYALARLTGLDGTNTMILVLYGLVPTALYASLVAEFFGLDTNLTSAMFAVSTVLFAFVVLPLYLWAAT
jgi:predicted permease